MSEIAKISLNDIQSLMETLGLKNNDLYYNYVKNFLKENWVEVVGEGYINYTYPLSIKNDKLIILITHDIFKMELEFKKTIILQKINHLIGRNLITKLAYKQGLIPKRKQTKKQETLNKEQKGNPEFYKLIPATENIVTQQKLKELIDLFPKT